MFDQPGTIIQYLDEVGSLLSSLPAQPIQDIVGAILTAYRYDRTTYIVGNGGSASTATHFACDLQKWTITPEQPRLKAVALTDNMALFSAWANDYGYEHVFEQQLRSLLKPGDVVIGISASGKSPNVVRALTFASAHGAITAALTGNQGGDLLALVDHCLVVPGERINQIEDVHMTLCHVIADTTSRTIKESTSWAPASTMPMQMHAVETA